MSGFNESKYKNAFAKENYDRIALNVPKGYKDRIKAKLNGQSMNDYIFKLILKDMFPEELQ